MSEIVKLPGGLELERNEKGLSYLVRPTKGPKLRIIAALAADEAEFVLAAFDEQALAVKELTASLEGVAECLAVSLDRLGIAMEGDGKDRRASGESYGGTEALLRANAVLAKHGSGT